MSTSFCIDESSKIIKTKYDHINKCINYYLSTRIKIDKVNNIIVRHYTDNDFINEFIKTTCLDEKTNYIQNYYFLFLYKLDLCKYNFIKEYYDILLQNYFCKDILGVIISFLYIKKPNQNLINNLIFI